MLQHFLFAICIFYPAVGFSAVPDSSDISLSVVPLPIIAYSPETDLILGATALGQFKLPGSGADTRSSNVIPFFNYTLKNQFILQVDHTVFSPGERYKWTGELRFDRFPQSFWGIGYDTKEDDELLVDQRNIILEQSVYKKIGQVLFTGPGIRFVRQYGVSFETTDGDAVTLPGLTGHEGHTGLGIGWGILYDSRNSVLTPTEGSYLELNSYYQHKSTGSTYSFGKIKLDARNYIDLSGDQASVLALQVNTVHSFGDVPFEEMAFLGGLWIMRGLYEGRFRDQNSIAVQTEIRRHLFWRIGAVAFLAAGNVGNSVSDAFTNPWRLAGGGGLRFNIGRDETTNIRLDFSVSEEMSGLYITFGEAF